MKIITAVAVVMTVMIFVGHPCYAIYQWTDEKGQIHITDMPKPRQEQGSEIETSSDRNAQLDKPANNEQTSTPIDLGVIRPTTEPKNAAPAQGMPSQPQFDQMAAQRSLEKALMPAAQCISAFVLFGFIHFMVFVLTLMNIMKSEFKNNINKLLWVLLVLFLPLLGVILYFFIGRQQRVEQEVNDIELPRRRPRELDL